MHPHLNTFVLILVVPVMVACSQTRSTIPFPESGAIMWVQPRDLSVGGSADPFGDIHYFDLRTRTIYQLTDDEFFDVVPATRPGTSLLAFETIRTDYDPIRGLGSPSSVVMYDWAQHHLRVLDTSLVPRTVKVTSEASFRNPAITVTSTDTLLYCEAVLDYQSMLIRYSFHSGEATVVDPDLPLTFDIIASQNSDHIAMNRMSGSFRKKNIRHWAMIIDMSSRDTVVLKNDSVHFAIQSLTSDSALVRITPADTSKASIKTGYFWVRTSTGRVLGKLDLPFTTCGETVDWISNHHKVVYAGDPVAGRCGESYDLYELDLTSRRTMRLTSNSPCAGIIRAFMPH